MAKTTNCAFCGKELTKGLFKGNNVLLDCGTKLITCCEECYEHYKTLEKTRKQRFGTKLTNLMNAKRIKKISDAEVAAMYRTYVQGEENQVLKWGAEIPCESVGIFLFSSNGCFSVREYATGFVNSDINAKDMLKSLKKSAKTDCLFFDRNDITKIEYAKVGMGTFGGLFSKAYSFVIRLNDEKELTYKPAVTKTAMVGHGFGFGYRRSAEKKLVDQLEYFKKKIGSDLPIVKVNKF